MDSCPYAWWYWWNAQESKSRGRYNRVVIPAAIYDCWVFLSQIVSFPPWSIFLLQTGLDSDDIFWGALAVCPESACGSYPILQQFMEKDWWTIKIITIHFVVLVAVVLHQIGNSLKAQPLITPLTLSCPVVKIEINGVCRGVRENPILEPPLWWFIFHILSKSRPRLALDHPFINGQLLEWLVKFTTFSLHVLMEWKDLSQRMVTKAGFLFRSYNVKKWSYGFIPIPSHELIQAEYVLGISGVPSLCVTSYPGDKRSMYWAFLEFHAFV